MPLIKSKIAPGVVKDTSALAAEGRWVDSDKIRFVGDLPQTIGGFAAVSATPEPSVVFDSGVFDGTFRSSLAETTEMYPGQVRAAHAWTGLDGTDYLAWGTGSGLFVMYNSVIYDITPTDFQPESDTGVPISYGSGSYGSGSYTDDGSRVMWSLDNWGEILLACPRGQSLFEWTPGDDMATINADAPTPVQFMFVSTAERIVVLLGTTEFGGDYNPMLVRWSAQGDRNDWTPTSFNISGEFPCAQGSILKSGLATRGLNLLWSDDAIYTMQFTGATSSVFVIRAVGRGCGIVGPQARCASDSAVFWWSNDNFYSFSGQVPQIIPSTLREDIFNNLDRDNIEKCHVGWNTGYGEPWFFYPDSRDATGECSRYGMVNQQGQWASGTFDRTAWVSANVFPHPIAFSANDRLVYEHELPGQGGASLGAFVESGFIDLGDGDTLYVIKRVVPDFHNQGPNIDLTIKTKMWPNDTATEHGPYSLTPTTTKKDFRKKAREIAYRLESSEDDAEDSYWALGAISFDAQPSQEKR